MADHARKQVRAAVVSCLTGLTTTGARVYTDRVAPLTELALPGWSVRVRDETAEFDAMGIIRRTGRVVIEGAAQLGDGLEDLLDQMAVEAETALMAPNGALQQLVQIVGPPATQIEVPDGEKGVARRTGRIGIAFEVGYRTPEGDPTTIV